MIPLFYTRIDENGDLILPRSLDFKIWCNDHKGKKIILTPELKKSKRSLNQNAYLWGVVYPCIADVTGNSVPELHEIMKRLHLPPKILSYKGKEIKIPGSTTELNVSQMMEFLERIISEGSELGAVIPEANQVKI